MTDPADKQQPPSDEERARALLNQIKGVHAVDVARDMALGLVNFSSPKLGLSDETRAVRDLDDVRVSIELLRAVVGVLDAEGGHPTHDLHDTLAQLQLAYAHAVQLAGAERAAGATGAPQASPGEPAAGPETAAAAAGGAGAEPEPAAAAAQGAGEAPAAQATTAEHDGEEPQAAEMRAQPRQRSAETGEEPEPVRQPTDEDRAAKLRPADANGPAAGKKRSTGKKKPAGKRAAGEKKPPAGRKKPPAAG